MKALLSKLVDKLVDGYLWGKMVVVLSWHQFMDLFKKK